MLIFTVWENKKLVLNCKISYNISKKLQNEFSIFYLYLLDSRPDENEAKTISKREISMWDSFDDLMAEKYSKGEKRLGLFKCVNTPYMEFVILIKLLFCTPNYSNLMTKPFRFLKDSIHFITVKSKLIMSLAWLLQARARTFWDVLITLICIWIDSSFGKISIHKKKHTVSWSVLFSKLCLAENNYCSSRNNVAVCKPLLVP